MTEQYLYPVLALACLALAGAGLVVVRLRARARRLDAVLARQAEQIARLDRDLGALLSCSRRIGDRIGDAERSRDTLQKQLDRLRHHQPGDDREVALEHAMKLLNGGLAIEEVVRTCELSEGEAEILQSLARFRAAA
jgi:hypothetical protein